MKIPSLVAFLSLLVVVLPASAVNNHMKAFPPADEGMVRHVLTLQKQDDESIFKVELIVGKTVQLDEVNQYSFEGKIEPEIIQGWGFTRYVVSELGSMLGTRIAVDPNAPRVDRFITLSGGPYMMRYNSRLPVVVYAPEGVEVRYRIWNAPLEFKPMDPG